MKLSVQKPNPTGNTHLSLSKDEKNAIEAEFTKELEEEHEERERRAQEKLMRSVSKKVSLRRQTEKEVAALKSEMRRQFYTERGYKLSKDPTGRAMWLSPTEQQSQNRRRGRRKKSKLKKSLVDNKNTILMYASVIMLAMLVAVYIVKQ